MATQLLSLLTDWPEERPAFQDDTLFVSCPEALGFKRFSFQSLSMIRNSLQYSGRGRWGARKPTSLGSKEIKSRQSTEHIACAGDTWLSGLLSS